MLDDLIVNLEKFLSKMQFVGIDTYWVVEGFLMRTKEISSLFNLLILLTLQVAELKDLECSFVDEKSAGISAKIFIH